MRAWDKEHLPLRCKDMSYTGLLQKPYKHKGSAVRYFMC